MNKFYLSLGVLHLLNVHTLFEMQKYRSVISLQIANKPKFYLDVDLEDNIDNIMKVIKRYYKRGKLYV